MQLKGSKTEQNLLKAFAGESQAKTRYEFFAGVAKKEGYEQIAAIFPKTALNEKNMPNCSLNILREWLKSQPPILAGVIGTTAENLKAAADGEHEECRVISSVCTDCQRGRFQRYFRHFYSGGQSGSRTRKRYRKLLQNIVENKVFEDDEKQSWTSRNCGYVHKGKNVPDLCPVCKHAKAYFERRCENY